MTTWAPQETQKEIFELLGNDATLVGLLGGTVYGAGPVHGDPKVYDLVPNETEYPYVSMDISPFNDRGNHTKEGWECEFQINVFYRAPGRGKKQVQLIQKRIDELLHQSEICIEGWNNLGCRRLMADILTEDDNVTLHGIQRFKILLGEA
jgi:hypothetical protein